MFEPPAVGVGVGVGASVGVGVVVPIRAFALGKARLAGHLAAEDRAELARRLADCVVTAAAGLRVLVVSSDDEVRRWAEARSVAILDDPGSLDGAAAAGRAWFAAAGATRVVVAHADLPRATTFRRVIGDGAQPIVTLVPCHRDDGTPVLSLPAHGKFTFRYGPGSFRRHVTEAHEHGLAVRVIRDPDLAFDVDTVDDLAVITGDASRPPR
jgi:2-phospho-L-lactate/phosphoenolpyruvate guanylyltransferase